MNKISVILLSAATLVVTAAGYASDPIKTRYIKDRIRIVTQDTKTIPGSVITEYRQGAKGWMTTNNLTVINRNIVRPKKYSKLKLIVAAKEAGKWEEVKAAIQAMNLEDEWQACQYITSDYPAYISATNIVISQGIASEKEVQDFMKLAEDYD